MKNLVEIEVMGYDSRQKQYSIFTDVKSAKNFIANRLNQMKTVLTLTSDKVKNIGKEKTNVFFLLDNEYTQKEYYVITSLRFRKIDLIDEDK